MAETIELPNLDPNKIKEQVRNLQQAASEAGKTEDALKKIALRLKDVEEGTKAFYELNEAQKKGQAITAALQKEFGTITLRLAQAENQMKSFRKEITDLKTDTGVTLDVFSSFADKMVGFGAMTAALSSDIARNLIDPLGSTQSIISALPAPLQKWNQVMRSHREIIDLVNTAYAGFGRSMKESEQVGKALEREIRFMSTAFGFSRDKSMEFIRATKSLPPIMLSVGKAASAAGQESTQLSNIFLALRDAGMEVGKSVQFVDDLYKKFGIETAPEVTRQIIQFSRAANTTGVNIEIVQRHLVAASEPLAIFGQKADAASRTWTTFVDSLKDTVPIEEIGRLVNTVTGQIAKMDVQTRAFVAQASGMARGASAIGGALRMEMALERPGGLEKNLEAVTKMISRLAGGRITTREEAVRSPALEMQHLLQRQLVGQTLGVQGGQEQARVLEVLKDVRRGGMSRLEGEKTLEKVMASGRDIQKASLTALEDIATSMTRNNTISNEMWKVEKAMSDDLTEMRKALVGGVRTGEPLGRERAYVAGVHARSALARAGGAALEGAERIGGQVREVGPSLAAGLGGRLPPYMRQQRQGEPPVRPEEPSQFLIAERRAERVSGRAMSPALEAIMRQRRREAEATAGPQPFTPLRRVVAPPPAMAPPAAPAPSPETAAAGRAVETPAATAAPGEARVRIDVVCEECHRRMTEKIVETALGRQGQHEMGIQTGAR